MDPSSKTTIERNNSAVPVCLASAAKELSKPKKLHYFKSVFPRIRKVDLCRMTPNCAALTRMAGDSENYRAQWVNNLEAVVDLPENGFGLSVCRLAARAGASVRGWSGFGVASPARLASTARVRSVPGGITRQGLRREAALPGPERPRSQTFATPGLAVLLSLAFATLFAAPAHAQTTFVSNTGQSESSTDVIGKSGILQFVRAQQFTTGGYSGGYVLTEVVVALGAVGSDAVPKVSIYSNVVPPLLGDDAPGSNLDVLTNPGSFSANANNTFTAPAGGTLDANTKYWIVFENENTGDGNSDVYEVSYTDSGSEDSGRSNGWSLRDSRSRGGATDAITSKSPGSFRIAIRGKLPGAQLTSAEADGTSLELTFDESLDENSEPGAHAFLVWADGQAIPVSRVAVSGSTVTLTLSRAVSAGSPVTVSYGVPLAKPLQSRGTPRVRTPPFTNRSVTNSTVMSCGTGHPCAVITPVGWTGDRLNNDTSIRYTFDVTFSRPLPVSGDEMYKSVFEFSGTTYRNELFAPKVMVARRLEERTVTHGGQRRRVATKWRITVAPLSSELLTVGLRNPSCGSRGALCTLDGAPLTNSPSVTLTWADDTVTPPIASDNLEVTVEDASAAENSGRMEFTVRLSKPYSLPVWGRFRTIGGGTARGATPKYGDEPASGSDYLTTYRQFIFIPAGKTTATMYVDILEDSRNERDETFKVQISELETTGGAPVGITPPGQATGTITAPMSRQQSQEPLTAKFLDVPVSHDGENAFTVRVEFSEDVEITPEDLRDHVLSVRGGAVTGVSRVDGAKDLFEVTVEPDGDGLVSVMLAPTSTTCTDEGAVCTADAVSLTSMYATGVRGPGPGLTVADAEANESDENASLDFVVTLSPAATDPVMVDYATSDGTATAGEDYTQKSGRLTFAEGETSKTVSVDIIDDAEEDDGETVTFTLSGATDAALDDSEAIGTIRNTEATEVESASLSASFSDVPDEHDGSANFTVQLDFSEAPKAGIRRIKESLEVTGAALTRAVRVTRGDNARWTVTLKPSGNGAVQVSLAPPTEACNVFPTICTPDGHKLTGTMSATIPGPASPPLVSIAAATSPVTEGAAASFTLSRTGDTTAALTVAVSVSEAGSVLSGTPASTVTFAVGNAAATLNAATENDAVDEADARVTASVSTGTGYTVAPGAGSAGVDVHDNDTAASGEATVTTLWSTTLEWTDMNGDWLIANAENFTNAGWSEDGADYNVWYFAYGPYDGELWLRLKSGLPAGGIPDAEELTLHIGGATVAAGDALSAFAGRKIGIADKVWQDWEEGDRVSVRLTRTVAVADATASLPGISVQDAEVREAAGAALSFSVTLGEAQTSAVSVRYATSDVTAVAGQDYKAVSGVLRFEPGQTVKTVSVPVINDEHDDDGETMTLTLSSPFGATISDGTAIGTIRNTDPMPQAWIARFGRTVANQVLEAVEGRITAPRVPGTEVSLGGRQVGGAAAADGGVAGNVGAPEGPERGQGPGSQTMTQRDFLLGSSFSFTGGTERSGTYALWGRGAVTRFDGREGELSLDGDVTSGMLGADWSRDALLAGLVVSHSQGDGSYRGEGGNGAVSSSLTGLYPWGRYSLSERLSVWGVAGYGEGTLTLAPEGEAPIRTDLDLLMAAAGLRGVLVQAPETGGLELAVKTDVLGVQTSTAKAEGLEAAEAEVTRLRLGLEGSRAFGFASGASFTPSVELGVRQDGGDAETGFGADIGAGIAWNDPARGLSAGLRARGLLTHEDGSFSDRGLAGSLAWDPAPDSGRGPSLSLSQTVGAEASGGVEALLGPQTAQALEAADDNDGNELKRRTLEAKIGYGLALFDNRWTGTPELRLGLTGTSRETVLGWRLAEETRAGLAFGLDVEGARRESAEGAAGQRLGLGFGWQLESAGAERFELRIEGSRLEPANEATEHRIGLSLSARW